MAPTTRENDKKTTRDSASAVTAREEKNPKRQCTTKAVARDTNPINDGGWDRGLGDDDDEDSNKVPTIIQLSKELCRIVDPARYSNDEIVCSLGKLISWNNTKDPDFFRNFDRYSGINKVLDFLIATVNNSNCQAEIRMKFIEMTARVISGVCDTSENTFDIVNSAMDCDVMKALINASDEYNGGDDHFELRAVESIWGAFVNITYDVEMSKDQVFSVCDTGIDIISHLKSVDDALATETLGNVFYTLYNLVPNEHVNKKFFKETNYLSKCLDVFKKNNHTWECRTVELTTTIMLFFGRCSFDGIFDQASDYEQLLPFIIFCAKKFSSDTFIQYRIIDVLTGACKVLNDKKIIEREGALAILGELLASNDAGEGLKNDARTLISRITAP